MASIFSLFSILNAQPKNADLELLIGGWEGEGRFYNVKLRQETGPLTFQLLVSPELEVSGKVGTASLTDTEISLDKQNNGLMIRGKLSGMIFPNNKFNKRKVILLIQIPHGEQVSGDFHLKDNYLFDLSMRPGDFSLRRIK